MILSNHIINNADSELSNSEENIPRIKSGNIIISILEIKYYQGIKGNNIEICVLSPT